MTGPAVTQGTVLADWNIRNPGNPGIVRGL